MKITQHGQQHVYQYTFDEHKEVTAYGHKLVLHSFKVVIRVDMPLVSHIVFTDTRNEEFFYSFQEYYKDSDDPIMNLGKECLDSHMKQEKSVNNVPLASEILNNKTLKRKEM